ncbi:MAG: DUF4097 family beta strand repeat-containing protein [Elusimicrobiota bacterium]
MKRNDRKLSTLSTIETVGANSFSKPVLWAACALIASTAFAADPFESKSYPASSVREIVVTTAGGAVSLTASAGASVNVDVSPAAAPGDDCQISQQLRGSTLTLVARAPGSRMSFGPGKQCSAGFAVSAPAGVSVKAASGSGNVSLGAFSAKADIKTGSGDVAVSGFSGELIARSGSGRVGGDASGPKIDVNTGSGNVDLSGLTGGASVKTGSGEVSLSWARAPRSGKIDVRTGSGGLNATFPAAARLKVSAKSGSGSLNSDFVNDGKASLELTFRSGSGSATLKKAL